MNARTPAILTAILILGAATVCVKADTYSGPRPPKPDVPYLWQADKLVETEAGEAREENRKNETAYVIAGAASPARTPLAEPVFIMESRNLNPETMELYKLEVRNGNREVTMGQKKRKSSARPIHVLVTRIGDKLYKIEADEHLDNGEYSLSPNGSNRVFCFEIY